MKSVIFLLCLLWIVFLQNNYLNAKINNKSFCSLKIKSYEGILNCWKKKGFLKYDESKTAIYLLYKSNEFLSTLCNYKKNIASITISNAITYKDTIDAFISLVERGANDEIVKVLSQVYVRIKHSSDSSIRIHQISIPNLLILHNSANCTQTLRKNFLNKFILNIWTDSIINYYRLEKKQNSKKYAGIDIDSTFDIYLRFLQKIKLDSLKNDKIEETIKSIGKLYKVTFQAIEQIKLYEWDKMPKDFQRKTYDIEKKIQVINKHGIIGLEINYMGYFENILNMLLDQTYFDKKIDELYEKLQKHRTKNKTIFALVIIPIIFLICICLYKVRTRKSNGSIVSCKINNGLTKKTRQYATLNIVLDSLESTVNEIKNIQCEIVIDMDIIKIYSNRILLNTEMDDEIIIKTLLSNNTSVDGKSIETLESLIKHIRGINAFLCAKLISITAQPKQVVITTNPQVKIIDKSKYQIEYEKKLVDARQKIKKFNEISKQEYANVIIDLIHLNFGFRPHKALRELEDMMKILIFNHNTPSEAIFFEFLKNSLFILQSKDLTLYEKEKQKITRHLKKL